MSGVIKSWWWWKRHRGRFPIPPAFPYSVSGLKMRLDSTLGVKFNGAMARQAGKVDTWQDQSGLGNHQAQTTDSKRPRYDWKVLNGYPGLYFGGAQNMFKTALASTYNTSTIFAVAKLDVAASVCDFHDGNGAGRHLLCTRNSGGFKFCIYQGAALITGPATTTNGSIVTGRFDGAGGSYIEVNGAGRVTGNAGANTLAGNRIGAEQSEAAGEWLVGYLFEMLLYSPSLSDADVTTVTNYLKARYAIA